MAAVTVETIQQREGANRDGYCVVPQVVGETALNALSKYSKTLHATPTKTSNSGRFDRPDYRHPAIVEALTSRRMLDIPTKLGYPDPKVHNMWLTTKPPRSEALHWHRDAYYEYPISPDNKDYKPPELFWVFYLEDTTEDNGCMRVVPGSHRQPQNRVLDRALGAAKLPGEKSVPMRKGDLFIGDRNLLHATHANNTDRWRIGVTMAMAPDFARLPEEIQARIVAHIGFKGWWPDQAHSVDPKLKIWLPVYRGNAAPIALLED